MAERRTVLMTVTGAAGAPSLADAAAQLGLPQDALNPAFGVVPIDPASGRYVVEAFADRLPPEPDGGAADTRFSNPPIAPFGPVKKP
ncbi:hypothetical protein ACI7BZ_08690 [Xanthobacter sp. AM11]|uniref:hypothetical protein n=1 Tax=Xanthobacter sp. AM11 TaxID=3380643 RepID=UPI0039BFE199